jgi:DNA repair photolyase
MKTGKFAYMDDSMGEPSRLPEDYTPERPEFSNVERIYLARGSLDTKECERFVERICALYPDAEIFESLDTPHNSIELNETAPLDRHLAGKHALLFGEHKSSVRFSAEEGNSCPNYWHFSAYGFCPYGCRYCFLAGTRGVWHSPTVKIFVNLPEIIAEIAKVADRLEKETAFYHGKLQDGLALDTLTAYSTILVPFFARHKFARHVLLTKSANVERLLPLEHNGRTTLSWSLSPPEVADCFEENTPGVEERIKAMERVARAGYPVRAVIMPIIPMEGWENLYSRFLRNLLARVPLQRITFGGICSYKSARMLMNKKLGPENAICDAMEKASSTPDGRVRYRRELRVEIYEHLMNIVRETRPDLAQALCLEEISVWDAVGLKGNLGRCNCVL